jgi:hypothetical protein
MSIPIPDGDSGILKSGNRQPNLLEVLETGKLTVVGFGSKDAPDDLCLAGYREQIRELIREHQCTDIAFDLKAFKKIASVTLGLIASIRSQGVKVHVFNVSPSVAEVFALTNLDQHIEMSDPRIGR